MVFNLITNAPGMLQPQLQWGRLQDLASAGTDPEPTLQMSPTAYGFKPPKVYAWNVGVQRKLWSAVILDVAYVGSSSKDLLRQEPINAVPYGAKFLPENQDPTRAPSTVPGATALPDDLLRPYPGYANIGLLEYTAYSNYHALQASLNRRFDNGLMFSVFYVWSKALGIANDDFAFGRPNATDAETRRADYSYLSYDRPHNFVVNFVYQTPKVASGVLGVLANDWQISGIYRWTSGRPYAISFSIPGIGPTNLTGSDPLQNARVVVTCDPGKGWSNDPYRQIDTSCFAPPQPGSDGTESARFFLHGPPINNLDLSLSKAFVLGKGIRLEVRLDAFNALNHTQFTGVNSTVSFASLSDWTITNLPLRREWKPGPEQRLRKHQRRGAAADAPARHAPDVLGEDLSESSRSASGPRPSPPASCTGSSGRRVRRPGRGPRPPSPVADLDRWRDSRGRGTAPAFPRSSILRSRHLRDPRRIRRRRRRSVAPCLRQAAGSGAGRLPAGTNPPRVAAESRAFGRRSTRERACPRCE